MVISPYSLKGDRYHAKTKTYARKRPQYLNHLERCRNRKGRRPSIWGDGLSQRSVLFFSKCSFLSLIPPPPACLKGTFFVPLSIPRWERGLLPAPGESSAFPAKDYRLRCFSRAHAGVALTPIVNGFCGLRSLTPTGSKNGWVSGK